MQTGEEEADMKEVKRQQKQDEKNMLPVTSWKKLI